MGYTNCEENCQVYEDHKELERLKKQNFDYNIACTRLEERAKIAEEKFKDCFNEIIEIKKELTDCCFDCMNNSDHEICGDCIENKILNRLEVYVGEK